MALNYWKLGGKPTYYNPLTSNLASYVPIGVGDHVVRFTARSSSGVGRVRVVDTSAGGNDIPNAEQYITITGQFATYEVSFFSSSNQSFFIDDYDKVGTIEIKDIELIRKPLPELTINGLDGFESGKWTINSQANVIDDETLELYPTSTYKESSLTIPVLPNTTYTISASSVDGDGAYIGYRMKNASGVQTGATVNPNSNTLVTTLKTSYDCYLLEVFLSNRGASLEKCTWKKPVVNLGSIPVPYSKKTGDKMTKPTPKKNLINFTTFKAGGFASATGIYTNTYNNSICSEDYIEINPKKEYFVSRNGASDALQVYYYDEAKTFLGREYSFVDGFKLGAATNNGANLTGGIKPSNAKYIRVMVGNDSTQIQLEESIAATTYSPYSVQRNKKNILPNVKQLIDNGQRHLLDQTWRAMEMPLKVGTLEGIEVKLANGSTTVNDSCTIELMVDSDLNNSNAGVRIASQSVTLKPSELKWVRVFEGIKIPKNAKYSIRLSKNSMNSLSWYLTSDFGDRFYSSINMGSWVKSVGSYTYNVIYKRRETKTGLSFDGLSDFVTSPYLSSVDYAKSFSVEGEFEINEMPATGTYCILQNSFGPSNRIALGVTNQGQLAFSYFDGVSWKGISGSFSSKQRVKYKAVCTNGVMSLWINGEAQNGTNAAYSGTDSALLYIGMTSTNPTQNGFKGVMYNIKITNLINNTVELEYDFENPFSITGNKVLQKAQNLIPSFDDSSWELHNDAQVLGEDVLRLNATIGSNNNMVYIPVEIGKTYLFSIGSTNGLFRIYKGIWNYTDNAVMSTEGIPRTLTIDSSYNSFITVRLTSGSAGTFDFVKPQLYKLDGKEGTINGKPVPQIKTAKRLLLAKR